jgi:hypothetical protein
MPRFYFDTVTSGTIVSDDEGTELPGLEEATAEAIQDARALMSAAIMSGLDISKRSIQIRDEAGEIVLVIPFSDAVKPEF